MNVATPRQAEKGGLTVQELFISFFLSVMASIVATISANGWTVRNNWQPA